MSDTSSLDALIQALRRLPGVGVKSAQRMAVHLLQHDRAGAQVLSAPREALGRWLRPDEGQPLSAHLYLVDPMGMWMMRLPADFEPAKAKRDLDRLLRASSSWDRAGRDPAIVGDGAAR